MFLNSSEWCNSQLRVRWGAPNMPRLSYSTYLAAIMVAFPLFGICISLMLTLVVIFVMHGYIIGRVCCRQNRMNRLLVLKFVFVIMLLLKLIHSYCWNCNKEVVEFHLLYIPRVGGNYHHH